MGTEIKDMLDGVPGVRKDWREDWAETSRADWRIDWDVFTGDVPGVLPVNTVLPVITGTLNVGDTLSVSDGTWTGTPAPTFTYQWRVDGADVVGETNNTYVLLIGDTGFMVDCVVTATNTLDGSGAVDATAVAVGPVV